jgi:lipoyl(octanoyl) transferase
MLWVDCGTVVYEEALTWQRHLVEARREGVIDDILLTLEHDPVYTAGRHADLDRNLVAATPVRVVHVERGGDLTYHGPGQVVAYPIVALPSSKHVRGYVDALVGACAQVAASFGLDARPDPERPGVWVGNAKIAAVGVKVDRGVTSHGLAFNVAPDLDEFRAGIVPCGIAGAEVCSLASLGVETTTAAVRTRLVRALSDALERPVQRADPADIGLPVSA